ncbi:hypothetical protein [Flavobacterium sp. CS20]|uniref:hypothetical protein n=1 Tax=Flavobacterium sp. CS20 TaxID=2775246 RepID=UPI001B3A55AA|nr:hypothetical protein [Flavobacterium sp. CS20]QTY26812.1 hypothetical protein IGB25_13190 [Flavobacterium sp. CS20]
MMKLIFLCILFAVLSCKDLSLKNNVNEPTVYSKIDSTKSKDTLSIGLPNNLKEFISKTGDLWLQSWTKNEPNFNLNDFSQEFKKSFSYEWEDYNRDSFVTLDEFTKESKFGWTVDLYSYHTVIESVQNISFGVDQKVYIYTDNQIMDFLTLGSDESIEDAFWLNDGKKLVLLGYYNDGKIKPIIWWFDFTKKEEVRYINSSISAPERNPFIVDYLINR